MKEGWVTEELNKNVKFIDYRGKTPTKVKKGIRLITAKNVKMGYVQREPIEFADPSIYDSWMIRGIPCAGDILFTTEAPLGNVAQLDTHEKVMIGQRLITMRPNRDKIDQTFLKYALMSPQVQEEIFSHSTGATVVGIKAKLLKQILISYPPLAEQKRIVAILNEAFEGIAAMTANAEKNLANAREMFESYLNAVFTQKGEGWVEKTLNDLTEVQSGGTPLRSKPEYWGGDIAWYSSGELNQLYTKEPERKITIEGLNNSNAKLFPKGSLLIGMYDTAALKMSIIDRDAAFNQAVAGAKPNKNIDLQFVLYAINSVKPQILNLRRGVRQKNLSLGKIKNITISIPNLTKQREVVNFLFSIKNETQRLESIYQQKLTALAELKQSLLKKAFAGELT